MLHQPVCSCGTANQPILQEQYLIPDALWLEIARLLPPLPPKKKPGRPRMDDRQAMTAIFYVLRTGCQWNALPRCLGASSTVHDRFVFWRKAGVFERLWQTALAEYAATEGIDWEWQSLDTAMTKAPLGGKRYRAESDGSGQNGHEAQSADRRGRDSLGRDRGWRQCA